MPVHKWCSKCHTDLDPCPCVGNRKSPTLGSISLTKPKGKTMTAKIKTAWLIEREDDKNPGCTTGACLGVIESGKISARKLELTTPDLAMRFCREEDAKNALFVFGLSASYIVTEHQWG